MIIDCKQSISLTNRDNTIALYFKDVRNYPVLTSAEERELIEVVKTGNEKKAKEARDKIIQCNQRFVISAAKKWQNGDNLLDLVNEGNIGLMKAIDGFDLNKKQRFLTYAVFWIRKAINEYIANTESSIRTLNTNKVYTYASKARNSFFLRNERYPTASELKEEIMKQFDVLIPNDEDLMDVVMTTVDSYGTSENDDRDFGYNNEYDKKTATNNIEEDINKQHDITIANLLMSTLDDREKYVVKSYYGIGDIDKKSYELIGNDLGICKERVRQIMNEAMSKMKKVIKNTNYEN